MQCRQLVSGMEGDKWQHVIAKSKENIVTVMGSRVKLVIIV